MNHFSFGCYDAEHDETYSLRPPRDLPGTIGGARAAIAILGLITTLLLLAMLLDLYGTYRYSAHYGGEKRLWIQSPTLLLVAFVWLGKRKQSQLSFPLRIAFWMPFIHIALLGCGTFLLLKLANEDPQLVRRFSLLNSWKFLPWTALAASAFLLATFFYGLAHQGRKQLAFLHPLCVGLLLFTLLLGLWLAVTPNYLVALDMPSWSHESPHFRDRFLWITLLVPALLALEATLLATQSRVQRLAENYGFKLLAGSLLLILLLVAINARARANAEAIVAYANLAPLLVSAAMLSLATLGAVSLSHWQALRYAGDDGPPAPWAQEGEVILLPDCSDVGTLHYRSWFLGLQTHCDRFVLRTAAGSLLVPASARLIAPMPLWSSLAKAGEYGPVMRAGDRVRVLGFVTPPQDNAFRQSPLPIPGSKGLVVVALKREKDQVWQDLALLLWRPAILYLAVVTLIALPGLAGYFAL